MKTMIETIGDNLSQGQAVVTATIISKQGSAPREVGTKMLFGENSSMMGTIGGGLLEAMTIQLASEIFSTKKSLIKKFKLSDKDASLEGMVCGGNVEVLFEYFDPSDEEQTQKYCRAKELREAEEDFVIVSKILDDKIPVTSKQQYLFTKTEFYGESNPEIDALVATLRENFNQVKSGFLKDNTQYFIEPSYGLAQLCIVGAGHISQKIAHFAKELGFYTVVLDDRADFLNKERFEKADELIELSSFSDLPFDKLIHNNSYIVIVTRGHSFDKDVLEQSLKTDAKYIGMIGSKGKRNHVYSLLLKEGFTQKDIDRVACPIGVPINAQTPEEIAISILAQLIESKRS